MLELLFLFTSSLLAATIFPAQSEVILASLIIADNHDKLILLLIATTGNVLGSLINYYIGYFIRKFRKNKYFKIKIKSIRKYSKKNQFIKIFKTYKKWGVWTLLFAWVPIVGDPLTVIAGMFRLNIALFLALVTIGKLMRYILIILVF